MTVGPTSVGPTVVFLSGDVWKNDGMATPTTPNYTRRRLLVAGVTLLALAVIGLTIWLVTRPPAFMEQGTCVRLETADGKTAWATAECSAMDTVTYTVATTADGNSTCPSPAHHIFTDSLGRTACLVPNLVTGTCYTTADGLLAPVECATAPQKEAFRVTKVIDKADRSACTPGKESGLVYDSPARTICFSRTDV